MKKFGLVFAGFIVAVSLSISAQVGSAFADDGWYYRPAYRHHYYGSGHWHGPYYWRYWDHPYYGDLYVYRGHYMDYATAVGYCVKRFKTYDPYTKTYIGSDGYRHPCPLP